MKKILDKIIKLNVDIIFVENNISKFALEYFQTCKIAIVNKLKPKDLDAIKAVGKIRRSVKKIW